MIETMSATAVGREWAGGIADGRFPLLQWIGGSEAAGVFSTELTEPSRKAIIKLIPADIDDAEARLSAWEAASTLSHPNLMQVFAHGRCEIDGVQCLYVVTEFGDEVLAEILRDRPLSQDETRELLGPALEALSYLHGNGLVHSRLKPSNIMAAGDRLKLSTDGLAFAGAAARPSAARTVYDAPETEQGIIEPASDLWSLGATLVEVLTQRPPEWDGLASSEPMVPQSVPQPFAAIARRCLRADTARRGTIQAMLARLDPVKASPEPEVIPVKASPAKSRIVPLLALAAAVLIGAGIWVTVSHRTQPPAATQQSESAPPSEPTPQVQPSPPIAAAQSAVPPPAPLPAPLPQAHAQSQTQPEFRPEPQPAPRATQTPLPAATGINPAVVNQILPDIVPSALKTISGTLRVAVQLTVGADGTVTDAALTSAGPSKYFAGKSIEAARHWKFKPAEAPSTWTLEFQYTQSGIHVVAQPAAP